MLSIVPHYCKETHFKINTKYRFLIPIIKITLLVEMQYCKCFQSEYVIIFGLGNKITIIGYKKEVDIIYNVSTNKEEDFIRKMERNNFASTSICPFKYTLVSPKRKQS